MSLRSGCLFCPAPNTNPDENNRSFYTLTPWRDFDPPFRPITGKKALEKLIRDADKLDIYRIMREHSFDGDHGGMLASCTDMSDRVFADLMANRIVAVDHVQNRCDHMVLRLAWVFDVNYPPTLRRIAQRGYLTEIMAALPATERVSRLKHKIAGHLKAEFSIEI